MIKVYVDYSKCLDCGADIPVYLTPEGYKLVPHTIDEPSAWSSQCDLTRVIRARDIYAREDIQLQNGL